MEGRRKRRREEKRQKVQGRRGEEERLLNFNLQADVPFCFRLEGKKQCGGNSTPHSDSSLLPQ